MKTEMMMNNKQVYIFAKAIKRTSNDKNYSEVRNLRKMIRSLMADNMISYTQRDYLVGVILKASNNNSCVKHFYSSFYREFH